MSSGFRLLVVANSDGYVAVQMSDFLRRLAGLGVELHVLCPPGDFIDDLSEEGMVWHRLPLPRRGRGPGALLLSAAALLRTQRRVPADLQLLATALPVLAGGLAAWASPRQARVSVLPGLGHYFALPRRPWRFEPALLKLGFRLAASWPRTVTVFQQVSDRDLILGRELASDSRVRVIPGWGVDTDRFIWPRREASPPQVLMVSRQLWEKGVAEFVEAARLLRERGEAARFVLVGQPDLANPGAIPNSQLERWAAEGAVEWWGWRSDVPELLSRAAVLALPTRYGEGVPRILVEASAAGVPIVATDLPGCREVVEAGGNGDLVPFGNPEALAQAIGRLLERSRLRRLMGEEGRRIVARKFSADLVTAEFLDVFRTLGVSPPKDGGR